MAKFELDERQAVGVLMLACMLPMLLQAIVAIISFVVSILDATQGSEVHELFFMKYVLPIGPMISPAVSSLVNYANAHVKGQEGSVLSSAVLVVTMLINSGGWSNVSNISGYLAQASRSVTIIMTAISVQGTAKIAGHYNGLPAIAFSSVTIVSEIAMILFAATEIIIVKCVRPKEPYIKVDSLIKGIEGLHTSADEINNAKDIIITNRAQMGKPLLATSMVMQLWFILYLVPFVMMMYAAVNMSGLYSVAMSIAASACGASALLTAWAHTGYSNIITYPPGVEMFSNDALLKRCETVCGNKLYDLLNTQDIGDLRNAVISVQRDNTRLLGHEYSSGLKVEVERLGLQNVVNVIINIVLQGILKGKLENTGQQSATSGGPQLDVELADRTASDESCTSTDATPLLGSQQPTTYGGPQLNLELADRAASDKPCTSTDATLC